MLQREDWPIGEDDCQSCGIPGQAPRCESCVRWESGDRECDLDAAVRLAGAIGHAAVLDLSRRWATTGGTGEAVRRPRLCAEGSHWAARCALDLVLAMFESYRRNRSAVETALEMFAR